MGEKISENKRNIILDILRIVACFFVIVSHTNNYVFKDLLQNHNLTFFATAMWYIVSRTAVPIFFMISGALYLKKEMTYKEMLKKTICRAFIPLLFFSAIVYFKRNPLLNFDNFILFLHHFLNNEILGVYWFLYVLIGLYLATPLLQKLCKNMNDKDYKMLMIYAFIFIAIIPIFKHYNLFSITPLLSIPLVSTYIVYYILGHYFFNYDIKLGRKSEIILLIVMGISLLFGTIMTGYDHTNLNIITYYGEHNIITVFVTSIAFVYFFRKIFEHKKYTNVVNDIIKLFSDATFGVYLIHSFFLGHTEFIYRFLSHTLHINQMISIIIYQVILTFLLCLLVLIVKKIPIIKKII